jgi:hypothetical protein
MTDDPAKQRTPPTVTEIEPGAWLAVLPHQYGSELRTFATEATAWEWIDRELEQR